MNSIRLRVAVGIALTTFVAGAQAQSISYPTSQSALVNQNWPAGSSYEAPAGHVETAGGPVTRLARVEDEAASAAPAHEAAATCDAACNDCLDGCCDDIGSWLDNTELFIGGDAYASIGDSPVGGWNNSFGAVTGFNTGFGLGDSKVRGQFGASYGAYDFKGRNDQAFNNSPASIEDQIYATAGLYKRSDVEDDDNWSWAIAYDELCTEHWGIGDDALELSQVRGLVGYALSDCNEIGVWATAETNTDTAVTRISGVGGARISRVRAMNQANFFWHHNWEFGGDTTVWIGAMDNSNVGDWVLGLTGRAPLSHCTSLYGSFNYVTPARATGPQGDNEDQWNVQFGLVYYYGAKAVSPNVSGQQGLPLLPVANNGTFLITD